MADPLEGMAWANIIRIQSSTDREFAHYVLQARSDFLTLALRKDAAIKRIYLEAADRVAEEIKTLLPEYGKLRKAHLVALERNLRREAERISQALGEQIQDGISKAIEFGSDPLVKQLGRCLESAGADFSWLKLQRGFGDVNRRAVEEFYARTRKGIFLSDRIWYEGEKARNAIQAVVQDGIARGLDAVKIAQSVEQYLKVKTPVTEFKKMMERMGKLRLPKNLTYEALRMARTEMSIAFMEGTYSAGKVTPGYQGVMWCLSAAHPIRDECDDLATADLYGMGAGIYPAGEEPITPHPNCLCFVVPKMEPTDKFVERVKQWVNDPSSQPDLEKWYNDIYGGLTGRRLISITAAPPVKAPAVKKRTAKPKKQAPPPPLGSKKNPIKVENFQALGGGVSKTYVGTVDGKKYLFKSTKIPRGLNMRRNNLEAELLADKIFNYLGVEAPKTDFAWFDVGGAKKQFLRMEFVENVKIWDIFKRHHRFDEIDKDLFQRMQVIDVLIGNGDRHGGNFFLTAAGKVIPIDHNLAFATDMVIDPRITWQKCFLDHVTKGIYQTSNHILRRNYVGMRLLQEHGLDSYVPIAEDIMRKLKDSDIEDMVASLPDELAEMARKEELARILKWRRDHLIDILYGVI